MTKLILFFFSAALFFGCSKKQDDDDSSPSTKGYKIIAVTNGGSIQGTVVFSGERPAPVMIETQKDQDVCGVSHPNPSALGNTNGVAGCIIGIEHIAEGKDFTKSQYRIDQKQCEYLPHIQVLRTGSNIIISNSDEELHNFHIRKGNETIANEAQPSGAPEREVELKSSGLLSITCDVHPWMKGYIFCADHPYYTISDSAGAFHLDEIPPGDYTLTLWRDNWSVEEIKDAEGHIQSYKWGPDVFKKQQIHIDAAKNTSVQFILP